jgi:hypothetical protein
MNRTTSRESVMITARDTMKTQAREFGRMPFNSLQLSDKE